MQAKKSLLITLEPFDRAPESFMSFEKFYKKTPSNILKQKISDLVLYGLIHYHYHLSLTYSLSFIHYHYHLKSFSTL